MSLKKYFRDIMYDGKTGPLARVLTVPLSVASCFYAAVLGIHDTLYRLNLLKRHKARVRVISVGNITLGGTGKTPFVMMLSENLAKKGKKIGVSIRGYGEDEWKMLENGLKEHKIGVFVGRDRVKSANDAGKKGIDTLILDDGFQHIRLKRDLDIVLVDSTNPFGNRRLFPRGILREPISSMRRADFVVLTKVNKGKDNIPALTEEIGKIIPPEKIIKAYHKAKNLEDMRTGEIKNVDFLKNEKVSLVSAICDPSYFRYTVEKLGALIGPEFVFPDHYDYKKEDLKNIFEECVKTGVDKIVTTEKDITKIRKLDLPHSACHILTLNIELEITEGMKALDVLCNS